MRVSQGAVAERWRGVCLNQVKPGGPGGGGNVLQVDLDHLLLDGGWKRGEFDWLK